MGNYINNENLSASLSAWVKARKKAIRNKQELPPFPDDCASAAMLIAQQVLSRPNFKFYSWGEDMIADSMLSVLKYAHNFDGTKGTAFNYVTTLIWHSYIRFIAKEQKQAYTVAKIIQADTKGRLKHLDPTGNEIITKYETKLAKKSSTGRRTETSERASGCMTGIELHNEDCLTGLTKIADKSVDMILCDLPYGTTQNKWDSIIPLEPLWAHYKRVIKPKGAILLTATQPFTGRLAASNLGWLKYEWIWHKSCPTGYLNAHKMPMQQHESILVFGKGALTYNPQGLKPFFQMAQRGRATTNYGEHGSKVFQEYTNYPRSVLAFPYDKNKLHPTQKPTPLFEYLVRTYTNKNELVLDNAFGSGTTAIACMNSNRRFVGFELDATYFKIAKDRITDHAPRLTELFEEDAA